MVVLTDSMLLVCKQTSVGQPHGFVGFMRLVPICWQVGFSLISVFLCRAMIINTFGFLPRS
jgi:hypothetical protein